ncbi:MAG TPA: NUDIX domain-containing protein [Candidatus Saccharimonas sp.]|nr:NUDIX domain-containing protein [Candidatus Saccharimonas sp.]
MDKLKEDQEGEDFGDRTGKDYPGIGVGLIVVNQQRRRGSKLRVLVHKRGQQRNDELGLPGVRNEPFCWDFPGGGVEFGELLEDVCTREIFEEHGLVVDWDSLEELFSIQHLIYQGTTVVEHWLSHTFITYRFDGEPQIKEPHKCLEWRWVTLAELEQLSPITESVRLNLLKLHLTHPDWF